MEAQAVESAELPSSPPIAAASRKPRVLLVEDDPDMRRLVSFMLEKDGCEVIQAASGVGLFAGIECTIWSEPEDSYDLIVSDIQMPDLTALDVLSGLPERSRGIPIVLMTAYGSPEVRTKARALGAVAFLDKPFEWDTLRMAVHNALARQ